MTAEKDELISKVRDHNSALPDYEVAHVVNAVFNAGWRPPEPARVTDPKVLDTYPVGTVLRLEDTIPGRNQVWQRMTNSTFCWSTIGLEGRFMGEQVLANGVRANTALIIHVP